MSLPHKTSATPQLVLSTSMMLYEKAQELESLARRQARRQNGIGGYLYCIMIIMFRFQNEVSKVPMLGNPKAINASPLRSERIPATLPNTKEKSEKHEQWECIVHAHNARVSVCSQIPSSHNAFPAIVEPNHL